MRPVCNAAAVAAKFCYKHCDTKEGAMQWMKWLRLVILEQASEVLSRLNDTI